MWLGALLYQRSEDIYRMKGILSVQDMEERFVFQVTIFYHYFDIISIRLNLKALKSCDVELSLMFVGF